LRDGRSDDGAFDGQVTYGDLAAANRSAGRAFQVLSPAARGDSVALTGRFNLRRLPCGLSLHWTDSIDQHDLVTRLEQAPCVTMILFLKGRARATVGGRTLNLGHGDRPSGALVSHATPDLFTRQGIRGLHVRKVGIGIPRDWFDDDGPLGAEGLARVTRPLRDHGHSVTWDLAPALLPLVEDILSPSPGFPGLRDLYLGGRAMDILSEAFGTLTGGARDGRDGVTSPRDRRLVRARDYLDAHLMDEITLPAVARETAMSVSTLQRVFREGTGLSVFEYVRLRRLERARDDLAREEISVTEAAFRAGYGSAANFATAFKRAFGHSPRETRGRLPGAPDLT
jgi:AraC-like DNA-binding protein